MHCTAHPDPRPEGPLTAPGRSWNVHVAGLAVILLVRKAPAPNRQLIALTLSHPPDQPAAATAASHSGLRLSGRSGRKLTGFPHRCLLHGLLLFCTRRTGSLLSSRYVFYGGPPTRCSRECLGRGITMSALGNALQHGLFVVLGEHGRMESQGGCVLEDVYVIFTLAVASQPKGAHRCVLSFICGEVMCS